LHDFFKQGEGSGRLFVLFLLAVGVSWQQSASPPAGGEAESACVSWPQAATVVPHSQTLAL